VRFPIVAGSLKESAKLPLSASGVNKTVFPIVCHSGRRRAKGEPGIHSHQRAYGSRACTIRLVLPTWTNDMAELRTRVNPSSGGASRNDTGMWRKSREIRLRIVASFAMIAFAANGRRMALQLRPNCEYCYKDLRRFAEARSVPTNAPSARTAFATKSTNVCPNCVRRFAPLADPPHNEWRPGTCVVPAAAVGHARGIGNMRAMTSRACGAAQDIPAEER